MEPNLQNENLLRLTTLYDRKATELFVVMDHGLKTVVKDPGLDRPWCSPHVKLAENVANEVGGCVRTLKDAIDILIANEQSKAFKKSRR